MEAVRRSDGDVIVLDHGDGVRSTFVGAFDQLPAVGRVLRGFERLAKVGGSDAGAAGAVCASGPCTRGEVLHWSVTVASGGVRSGRPVDVDAASLLDAGIVRVELAPEVVGSDREADAVYEVQADGRRIGQLSARQSALTVLLPTGLRRLAVSTGTMFRSIVARETLSPEPGERARLILSRHSVTVAGSYAAVPDIVSFVRASDASIGTQAGAAIVAAFAADGPAVETSAATATPVVGASRPAAAGSPADTASLAADVQPPLAQGPVPANSPVVQPVPVAPALRRAPRKALVIGNDAYRHVPRLDNARADATALAKVLPQFGFSVTVGHDLDEKGMKAVLRSFASTLEKGDEAVFFYAGHGVQIGPANFLLPVDIRGDGPAQVRDDAIPLQRVLDDLEERNVNVAIVVIDACRDNPFARTGRSIGGRGLTPTAAATGQLIVFSAGAGQKALDRLDASDTHPNGLFVRMLLREIATPGLRIDALIRQVRLRVVEAARSVGHEQVPAIYDQLLGDFYFAR